MAEFWLGLACGAPCPSLARPDPGLATSFLACAGGAWLGLAWPRLASFLVSLSAWHGLAWLVVVWPRLALPRLAWPSLAQPGSAWPSLAELQGIAAGASNPTRNPSTFKGKLKKINTFPLEIEGLQVGLLVPAAIPRSSARPAQARPGEAMPGQARARASKSRGEARPELSRSGWARPCQSTNQPKGWTTACETSLVLHPLPHPSSPLRPFPRRLIGVW